MKKILFFVSTAVLCLFLSSVWAETAQDLTKACDFASNALTQTFDALQDDDLGTYYPFNEKKGYLDITSKEPIAGLSVQLYDKYSQPLSYDVQVQDEAGAWQTVASADGEYLVYWHALPQSQTKVRIQATCKERLRIAELRVFSEGDKPKEVQDWTTLDKCDLMLLTAHPDDEILWFGGLLPTYAGERGLKVQLAVLVPTGGERKLELLGALWHCGVTAYPAMLNFVDNNGKTVDGQYEVWKGKNVVLGRVITCIRRYRPEVIVTHGEKGEYGHGAHKTAADVAKLCIQYAADKNRSTKSYDLYGTWQVKKLYLHEYEKNPIVMDWTQPLAAFDNKTGYEVAQEAFQFHQSQVKRNWAFEIHGDHDNAFFGLYYSAVGEDTGIGDFMEHIELD